MNENLNESLILDELALKEMFLRFKTFSAEEKTPFLRNANNDAVEKAWCDGFKMGFRFSRNSIASFLQNQTQHDSLFVPGYLPAKIRELGESTLRLP